MFNIRATGERSMSSFNQQFSTNALITDQYSITFIPPDSLHCVDHRFKPIDIHVIWN